MQAQPVVTTIVSAISPYLGQTMAQTSIVTYCKRLGIGDTTDMTQVDALLKQLALGLNVFIGRDKTESVMRALRHELEGVTA